MGDETDLIRCVHVCARVRARLYVLERQRDRERESRRVGKRETQRDKAGMGDKQRKTIKSESQCDDLFLLIL